MNMAIKQKPPSITQQGKDLGVELAAAQVNLVNHPNLMLDAGREALKLFAKAEERAKAFIKTGSPQVRTAALLDGYALFFPKTIRSLEALHNAAMTQRQAQLLFGLTQDLPNNGLPNGMVKLLLEAAHGELNEPGLKALVLLIDSLPKEVDSTLRFEAHRLANFIDPSRDA